MFGDDVGNALKNLTTDLITNYPKDLVRQCERKLTEFKYELSITIPIGNILSKIPDLNGMPKSIFNRRLNSIQPLIQRTKTPYPYHQLLTSYLNDLEDIGKFSDTLENLKKVFYYLDMNNKENKSWITNNMEKLVQILCRPSLNEFSSIQLEESCFTLSVIIWKISDLFNVHHKIIISYLLSTITACCNIVQEYVDLRQEKWKESQSASYENEVEPLFHFPVFQFPSNKCLNRLLTVAYFTLAFCCDCVLSPSIILTLLRRIVNVMEVSRYHMMKLIRVIVLSIDEHLCKTDRAWTHLPWFIHNELIKFYVDKNPNIRQIVQEVDIHIRKCSTTKLHLINKPILDTIDYMTKVIEIKRYDSTEFKIDKLTEVVTWRQLLELEKLSSNRHSSDSESVHSELSSSTRYEPRDTVHVLSLPPTEVPQSLCPPTPTTLTG